MTRLHEIRTVPTSIEDAFAYTADFSNIAEWDPGITRSTRTDSGPIGVGSTFDLSVKFGPLEVPMTYVITEYDPPRGVVLEGSGRPLRAVDTITFRPVDGGTEVSYTADLEFKGVMRMLAPLMSKALDGVGRKAVDGLESRLRSMA